MLVALVLLAIAATAQATPDWTAPRDLAPAGQTWYAPSLGFASDGTELAAHLILVSQSPLDTRLVIDRRRAGGGWSTELTVDPAGSEPGSVQLAVAPSGAAVVAWTELTKPDDVQNSPLRYRAAYRSVGGSWGQPVTLANPVPIATNDTMVVAAIASDGTAAAGAVVDEASGFGEFQPDTNIVVAVHPPAGDWTAAEQLSPYNVSAEGLQLAFDASDQLTGAWSERYDEGASSSESDDKWRIVTRRRGAANGIWSAVDDLTTSTGTVNWPLLDVNSDGRAVVAWQWVKLDKTLDAWAATRDSAAAGWSSPDRLVHDVATSPVAAGVGPDGTAYVVYGNQASPATDDGVGVVRLPAGGSWSPPVVLRSAASWRAGDVAFLGSDAVLVWYAVDKATNKFILEASRWSAGAAAPDAARDIEKPDAGYSLMAAVADRRGSVVAVWGQPASRFAVLDGGAPQLTSANVPSAVAAGQAFSAAVAFADMWSSLGGEPVWDFGDGSPVAQGATVTHAYEQPGTYTISVHAADTLGNGATRTFTIRVDPPAASPPPADGAPALADSGVRDSARPSVRLLLPRCRRRETKRACARRRATRSAWRILRGTVSDAAPSSGIARVEVAIRRLKHGRATGTARYRIAAQKGGAWSYRPARLRPGTYVFAVRAIDAAGNVSRIAARRVELR